jgi:hypothetical protein
MQHGNRQLVAFQFLPALQLAHTDTSKITVYTNHAAPNRLFHPTYLPPYTLDEILISEDAAYRLNL